MSEHGGGDTRGSRGDDVAASLAVVAQAQVVVDLYGAALRAPAAFPFE